MKYSCSIVRWDRLLLATRGQHLVEQKYSGEHKRVLGEHKRVLGVLHFLQIVTEIIVAPLKTA